MPFCDFSTQKKFVLDADILHSFSLGFLLRIENKIYFLRKKKTFRVCKNVCFYIYLDWENEEDF